MAGLFLVPGAQPPCTHSLQELRDFVEEMTVLSEPGQGAHGEMLLAESEKGSEWLTSSIREGSWRR